MDRLHLINALVNGHAAVAAALALNAVHAHEGITAGALGVALAGAAYGSAWASSSMQGEGHRMRLVGLADEASERVLRVGSRLAVLPAVFTVAAWGCYLVPAFLR